MVRPRDRTSLLAGGDAAYPVFTAGGDACVPRHRFSCKPACAGLQLKWLGLEDLLTHHVEGLAIAHDEDLSIADDLGEVGLNFGIADSSMQLRLCCN